MENKIKYSDIIARIDTTMASTYGIPINRSGRLLYFRTEPFLIRRGNEYGFATFTVQTDDKYYMPGNGQKKSLPSPYAWQEWDIQGNLSFVHPMEVPGRYICEEDPWAPTLNDLQRIIGWFDNAMADIKKGIITDAYYRYVRGSLEMLPAQRMADIVYQLSSENGIIMPEYGNLPDWRESIQQAETGNDSDPLVNDDTFAVGYDWSDASLSEVPEANYRLASKLADTSWFKIKTIGNTIVYKDIMGCCGKRWESYNPVRTTALLEQGVPFCLGKKDSDLKLKKTAFSAVCTDDTGKESVCKFCTYKVAAYIRHLKNTAPEEIKRQRSLYESNKNAVEQKKKNFPETLIGNMRTMTIIDPDRIKEMVELIDDGKFYAYESVSEVKDNDGNYEKHITAKVQRRAGHCTKLQGETINWSTYRYDTLKACKQCPGTADGGVCKINLAVTVSYLRERGMLSDFIEIMEERVKKEIEPIRSSMPEIATVLKNNGNNPFYASIEGEDKNAVEEKVRQLCALINAEKGLEKKEQTLSNLSTELTKFRYSSNPSDPIYEYRYQSLSKSKIYILTGIDEFVREYKSMDTADGWRKRAVMHMLKVLRAYDTRTYVILAGTPKDIESFLELDRTVKLLFSNRICIKNMTASEVYDSYSKMLPDHLQKKLSPSFHEKFISFVAFHEADIALHNKELATYLADYALEHNRLILPRGERTRAGLKQLENLVGMDSVKEQVLKFSRYAAFVQKARAEGKKLPSVNYHMIFTGNPGTGKTTVARVIADVLFEIGVLRENKLIEVERKDLVAEYSGQTAPKTAAVIEKAIGGILFVDEAYSLNGGNEDSYGKEAMATLIKAMEDYRDRLVVIFAGYAKEMQNFRNINPGIDSRIGYTFNFSDYTSEELTEIFLRQLAETGLKWNGDIKVSVKEIMDYFRGLDNFGNGRFVSRILQNTLVKHAANTTTEEKKAFTVTKEDLPTIDETISTMVPDGRVFAKDKISKEMLRTVAYHELGHLVVGSVLSGKCVAKKITVSPDIASLGYVVTKTPDDLSAYTKNYFMTQLAVYLAGKECEEVFNGTHSTGCANDIHKAVALAEEMVVKYAMGEHYAGTASEIREDISKLIEEAEKTAKEVILKQKENIARMANALIEMKTIEGTKLDRYISACLEKAA